jgi:hypothetical protein
MIRLKLDLFNLIFFSGTICVCAALALQSQGVLEATITPMNPRYRVVANNSKNRMNKNVDL